MSVYADVVKVLHKPDILVSDAQYRILILRILAIPRIFSYFTEAEDYVLENPFGLAKVMINGVYVSTLYGDKYK